MYKSYVRNFNLGVVSLTTKTEDGLPLSSQIEVAKKHYTNLREESLISLILYMIPALVFTAAAFWFYFGVEEQTPFIGQFYSSGLNFVLLSLIIASIVCWGIFFWIQVKRSHERAKLWKDSLKSYEELIINESKFKTEEERRLAARESVKNVNKKFPKN